jgi:hypothetical protein
MLFSAECVESSQRLPELWRRFHSAADPPRDRMAARTLGREAPPSAKRVQVSYGTEEIVAFAAVLWLRSSVQPDMREFRLIAWLARGKDYCRRC